MKGKACGFAVLAASALLVSVCGVASSAQAAPVAAGTPDLTGIKTYLWAGRNSS